MNEELMKFWCVFSISFLAQSGLDFCLKKNYHKYSLNIIFLLVIGLPSIKLLMPTDLFLLIVNNCVFSVIILYVLIC